MDFLKIGKNGQMEFDFDSIAALISPKIAEVIKERTEYLVKEYPFAVPQIKIVESEGLITHYVFVKILSSCFYLTRTYYDDEDLNVENREYIDCRFVPLGVCEEFVKMCKEGQN